MGHGPSNQPAMLPTLYRVIVKNEKCKSFDHKAKQTKARIPPFLVEESQNTHIFFAYKSKEDKIGVIEHRSH